MKEMLKLYRPYAIEVGMAFLAGFVVGRYFRADRPEVDTDEIRETVVSAVKETAQITKRKMPSLSLENGKLVVGLKR